MHFTMKLYLIKEQIREELKRTDRDCYEKQDN